ncbi:hypothetical protein B0H13DRAFT_2355097 [Mycena leptocephala]|nr:hypothetical protein B0H13DRAFT_2355097 [Mycena leptocephala]
MYALGKSWNVSIYNGIRQFHESKCLDPYSQEVAIELGWPLLQVSCHQGAVLALEGFSESGDDGYDSARSELGDILPIQNAQIDAGSCTGIEGPTSEDISTANEGHSGIPDIPGASVSSGSQCCALEAAELLAPTRSSTIVMSVRFALIFVATALSLYEYLCPR